MLNIELEYFVLLSLLFNITFLLNIKGLKACQNEPRTTFAEQRDLPHVLQKAKTSNSKIVPVEVILILDIEARQSSGSILAARPT